MRMYCDSNIFRKVKLTSSQFNEGLFKSFEALKHSYIFLFSDAHLHDLEKSAEDYRIEDLSEMESYVGNNYLYRDPIKKEFCYFLATPTEAYESVDFQAMHEALADPYTYLNTLFDFEGGETLAKLFKDYFDMLLFNFPPDEFNAMDPEIKKLISPFKNVRTINDALKSLKDVGVMLDDKHMYKEYKTLISNYINREEYSFERWSFDFDEKMKDTSFSKTFQEMVDLTIAESDKNDEYTRFINTYTHLDFYGITQERSGRKKKLKANSYWDIHKDATHAYYGSKADYLISDDNGLLTKAFITYKLLGIDTQVLSKEDIVELVPSLLESDALSTSFDRVVDKAISTGELLSVSPNGETALYALPFLVFNYFNRFQTNDHSEYYSLQFFKSGNGGFMFAEVLKLIEKIEAIYGTNSITFMDGLETLKQVEEGNCVGQWVGSNHVVTLTYEMTGLNGLLICLNLLIPKPKPV